MGLVIIITFLLTSYFWAFVFYMISKERQRRDAYRPIGYYTSIEVDEQGLIVKGVITDKEIKKKLKD
jgi:hypothetical protein